jgi:hypothetical protein
VDYSQCTCYLLTFFTHFLASVAPNVRRQVYRTGMLRQYSTTVSGISVASFIVLLTMVSRFGVDAITSLGINAQIDKVRSAMP